MNDNCQNRTYDCDACPRNGRCLDQGIDGRPRWEDPENEQYPPRD